MYCQKCGCKINKNDKKCLNCGKKVELEYCGGFWGLVGEEIDQSPKREIEKQKEVTKEISEEKKQSEITREEVPKRREKVVSEAEYKRAVAAKKILLRRYNKLRKLSCICGMVLVLVLIFQSVFIITTLNKKTDTETGMSENVVNMVVEDEEAEDTKDEGKDSQKAQPSVTDIPQKDTQEDTKDKDEDSKKAQPSVTDTPQKDTQEDTKDKDEDSKKAQPSVTDTPQKDTQEDTKDEGKDSQKAQPSVTDNPQKDPKSTEGAKESKRDYLETKTGTEILEDSQEN